MRLFLPTVIVLALPLSGFSGEPQPYPVERYNLLWQTDVYKKQEVKRPSPQMTHNQQETPWFVAGVFSIDGKKGAVIMNRDSGAVEEVGEDYVSNSGITLTKIFPTASGQLPRIEVSIQGEKHTLTGVRNSGPKKPKNQQKSAARVVDLGKR